MIYQGKKISSAVHDEYYTVEIKEYTATFDASKKIMLNAPNCKIDQTACVSGDSTLIYDTKGKLHCTLLFL